MDGWNTTFLLGWPIFRCYVSFREGKSEHCRQPEVHDFLVAFFGGLSKYRLDTSDTLQKTFHWGSIPNWSSGRSLIKVKKYLKENMQVSSWGWQFIPSFIGFHTHIPGASSIFIPLFGMVYPIIYDQFLTIPSIFFAQFQPSTVLLSSQKIWSSWTLPFCPSNFPFFF